MIGNHLFCSLVIGEMQWCHNIGQATWVQRIGETPNWWFPNGTESLLEPNQVTHCFWPCWSMCCSGKVEEILFSETSSCITTISPSILDFAVAIAIFLGEQDRTQYVHVSSSKCTLSFSAAEHFLRQQHVLQPDWGSQRAEQTQKVMVDS